jgi:uncharacterized caspase-like protein
MRLRFARPATVLRLTHWAPALRREAGWRYRYLTRWRPWAKVLRPGLTGLLLACAAASAQAPLDVRVALVIGNGAYEHVPTLENPVNDAEAMSTTLRLLGFSVTELRNGSRAEMRQALESMRKALDGKQGIGVLYYAGHGVQLDLRNYMIPVEAKLASASDVPQQALDLNQVIEIFKRAGNRMSIVMLDACRDNPFSEQSASKGLAPMDAPNNTFLAYATAPGNVAEDGDPAQGNGLYTGYLVKELQKPATRIEDVFKRVRLQVRRQSSGRQIPWESTSLEEDFYFNDGLKYTFRPEDFERVRLAAREREAQLQRAAEQAQEQQRQQQALRALEALRAAEAQRLQELEAAQAQAREAERLRRLSEAQAREEAFRAEQADWEEIKDSENVHDYYTFLDKYPSGYVSEEAWFRIESLQQAQILVQTLPDAPKTLPPGAPRFAVGDWESFEVVDGYTKKKRITAATVHRIVGDEVHINGGSQIVTQSGMVRRNGFGTHEPGILMIPSDLFAGKRWKTAYQTRQPNGNRERSYWNFKITALEDVQVPAGVFRAYKVEGTGYATSLDRNYVSQLSGTHWIDPASMRVVRVERVFRNDRGQTVTWFSQSLLQRTLASVVPDQVSIPEPDEPFTQEEPLLLNP